MADDVQAPLPEPPASTPALNVEVSPPLLDHPASPLPQQDESALPTSSPSSDDSDDNSDTPPPQPHSVSFHDLANRSISFLSTAPPEQLFAISVGGVVVLYLVFGRLSLLIVGVIAGAVGHASLALTHAKKGNSDYSHGLTSWLEARQEANADDSALVLKTSSKAKLSFSMLPPMTARALEELTDAIVRDYVRYWYTPLLPTDDKFPDSVRNVLVGVMLSVYSRISSKRGADTFILFLMSASNTFIVFLRELASAREVDIGIYLENSPGSALSQMLDRELQTKKMRMAADDVLQSFVGRDILQCEPMRVFLTKILAGVVLELTVDKCSKPDWINSWVVYLLDEMTQPEALQKIDLGEATTQSDKSKRISRAEEEMTKALEEAETINKMIVDEDDRKRLSMDVSSFPKRLSVDASSIRSDDTDDHRYSGSGYASSSSSSVRRQEPALQTPPTPPQPPPPPPPKAEPFFASFDLIPTISRSPVLHRAHISLSDLTPPITANPYSLTPGEKALRSKPSSAEYLLQIEPASSTTPGWVVVRKHPDFEALHEVLKRIAAISGADTFRRHHAEMPTWRGETLGSLRLNLEGYLNDALHERGLAECEGMKRFLEKEPSTAPTTNRNSFAGIGKGWANPAAFAKMGQGALDALSKAPQGVAVGGKGLFGGMKKAFSVAGRGSDDSPTSTHSRRQTMDPFGELVLDLQARTRSASMIEDRTVKPQITCPTLVLEEQEVESPGGRPTPALEEKAEKLTDGRPASILKEQAVNHLAAIPLTRSESAQGHRPSVSLSVRHSVSASNFRESFTPASMAESNDNISLPPLPCDMPDDYDYQPSSVGASSVKEPAPTLPEPKPAQKPSKEPLTTQETQFIVEVVFAVLSELYTLSSAWTLRRSLLNVAKSILLRPGNASLENIRAVLQETVIDSYTTDEAVSGLVRKLTEAVFGNGEKAADAGEGLKERARELFMERGVPEALRGVMGAQASEEALGAVFDALQMETVARGVVGGVVLEGVRGVCQ